MATKKAKGKKVKDLDPKKKSADVKGGRKDLLNDEQRSFVRRVAGRVTGRPH
jgi:hypothetical protein